MTPIQLRTPRFDPAPYLARIARGEAACGELGLSIDAGGQWHYRGSPIGRPAIMKLFARILHRLPDGSYWLVTPAEQGRVQVEDVPFVIVELRAGADGAGPLLELRTNLDEWIPLDTTHPLRLREAGVPPVEIPYVEVRDGLEARLSRPVYYELVELAEPDETGTQLRVRSAGRWFTIGRLEDEGS